jgi:hypothetical protein
LLAELSGCLSAFSVFFNPYLLIRPDRVNPAVILLGLGGGLLDPFCHGGDLLVGVVEDAALLEE